MDGRTGIKGCFKNSAIPAPMRVVSALDSDGVTVPGNGDIVSTHFRGQTIFTPFHFPLSRQRLMRSGAQGSGAQGSGAQGSGAQVSGA